MATITSVTGNISAGGAVSVNGSGFGASQGAGALLYGTAGGAVISIGPISWSDTLIQITLPTNPAPDVSANSYIVVVVDGAQHGVRSAAFATTAVPATPGVFQTGQYVFAAPGANVYNPG